jgi:hypothetical protein
MTHLSAAPPLRLLPPTAPMDAWLVRAGPDQPGIHHPESC